MKAILKAPYRKALAVVGMSLAASVALASYSGAAFAQDAGKPAAAPAKPAGAKGQYVQRVAVTSSMGPGVKVDTAELAV